VLVVAPDLLVRSVAEFVAYAREQRQPVAFATSGTGSMGHFVGEMFRRAAGIDLLHVGYRGTAPVVQDMLAGNVKVSFLTLSAALPVIREGKLRVVASATTAPVPQLPDVPTFAEGGYPGILGDVWFGLMGPAALPAEIAWRVTRDAGTILADPAIRQRLLDQASTPDGKGPEAMAAQIREELPRWARVARDASIRPE
jgi:tripartite-type tricarboxylate transporter receptor subunit TctC